MGPFRRVDALVRLETRAPGIDVKSRVRGKTVPAGDREGRAGRGAVDKKRRTLAVYWKPGAIKLPAQPKDEANCAREIV